MRQLSIFLAFTALATPAAAQDIAFEPDRLDACLASNGGEACIGIAAAACSNTQDGSTTVGLGFCYGAERDWWDARLNETYQALMARERARDAESKEFGLNVPPTAPALRDMQRAWIVFRDAACAYEYSQWGGGTGGGPAHAACTMQMTGEQTLALIERLESQ